MSQSPSGWASNSVSTVGPLVAPLQAKRSQCIAHYRLCDRTRSLAMADQEEPFDFGQTMVCTPFRVVSTSKCCMTQAS
eukprot:3913423-Amphidinium_carterae.1